MRQTFLGMVMCLGLIGPAANAQSFNDCGETLAQVEQIMLSKFSRVYSANYAKNFIGNWVSSYGEFNISMNRRFSMDRKEFLICPQANRTFKVYNKSTKDEVGTISLVKRNVFVLDAGLNVQFERQGSMTAAND